MNKEGREKEEREEGETLEWGVKRRDFLVLYWPQAPSVISLPPCLTDERAGGRGRGRERGRHPQTALSVCFFHPKD